MGYTGTSLRRCQSPVIRAYPDNMCTRLSEPVAKQRVKARGTRTEVHGKCDLSVRVPAARVGNSHGDWARKRADSLQWDASRRISDEAHRATIPGLIKLLLLQTSKNSWCWRLPNKRLCCWLRPLFYPTRWSLERLQRYAASPS